MALETTWMDDIIGDRTNDWMEGYIFGSKCATIFSFTRGGWDRIYNQEIGWVFVCEDDVTCDNE